MLQQIAVGLLLSTCTVSWVRADADPGAAAPAAAAGATQTRFEDAEVPFEPKMLPKVEFSKEDVTKWQGDALIVGIYQDSLLALGGGNGTLEDSDLVELDEALGGLILGPIVEGLFTGALGQPLVLWSGGNIKSVILLGMGPSSGVNASTDGAYAAPTPVFQTIGRSVGEANAAYASSALYVADGDDLPFDIKDFAYGYMTAPLPTNRFTSVPSAPPATITLLGVSKNDEDLADAEAYAWGTLLARYLTTAPANVCNTVYMADAAKYIASLYDTMSLKILEEDDVEKLGMGAYLSVTQGSETPPKFIHMTYTPPGGADGSVALIGKGITFDSGGYNLKVGGESLIDKMNQDMGGAAAVLGAARTIGLLEPKGGPEIHFISAVCENMISGDASRPGDVVTSAAGITIEIGNTDAEGRLTLVDAFWYAQTVVGVKKIVDIATLTGDALAGFGPLYSAVMGRSRGHVDAVIAAGEAYGEQSWQMPLEPAYAAAVADSSLADTNNIVPGAPGIIGAGLFLSTWIDPVTEWVHVDMAGPGFGAGKPGYGAAMLAAWAADQ